ncbi:hypothetical protein [Methylobacterium brachiatum]|uniref:hypothetical protein n=1 Tax=Methylobacterium brachiatum TaxID=269660 RepID=UPI0013CF0BFF|nr:hypothetical protein [Methylobacterium brachiatum]
MPTHTNSESHSSDASGGSSSSQAAPSSYEDRAEALFRSISSELRILLSESTLRKNVAAMDSRDEVANSFSMQKVETVLKAIEWVVPHIADAPEQGTASQKSVLSDIDEARRLLVRDRLDSAVRPVFLEAARHEQLDHERWRDRIGGQNLLADMELLEALPGVLSSKVMQAAIATHADPTLVPEHLRSWLKETRSYYSWIVPPVSVQEAFPDWNKPLTPSRHRHVAWLKEDVAIWFRQFPPAFGELLTPLDTWNEAVAAAWLWNADYPGKRRRAAKSENNIVTFKPRRPKKTALQSIRSMDEGDLEEFHDRVLIERVRREVISRELDWREMAIRQAAHYLPYGFLSLGEARKQVYEYDLKREEDFAEVFSCGQEVLGEWICDLRNTVIEMYDWPWGFSGSELSSSFATKIAQGGLRIVR